MNQSVAKCRKPRHDLFQTFVYVWMRPSGSKVLTVHKARSLLDGFWIHKCGFPDYYISRSRMQHLTSKLRKTVLICKPAHQRYMLHNTVIYHVRQKIHSKFLIALYPSERHQFSLSSSMCYGFGMRWENCWSWPTKTTMLVMFTRAHM